MIIGIHQAYDGLPTAFQEAQSMGNNTFQVFIRNNRNLRMRQITDWDFSEFNRLLLKSDMRRYVIHASYVMNPASYDEEIRSKTLRTIVSDMDVLSHVSRNRLYVLHPGASTDNTKEDAMYLLSQMLHEIMPYTSGATICVEMMAGQGTQLLSTVEECMKLHLYCLDLPSLKFCVDTCHVFAAGITLSKLVDMFSKIGIDRLGVIHMNGSEKPFGSRVDRHANLTSGYLKLEDNLAMIKELSIMNPDAPIILETPYDGILNDLQILKEEFM